MGVVEEVVPEERRTVAIMLDQVVWEGAVTAERRRCRLRTA